LSVLFMGALGLNLKLKVKAKLKAKSLMRHRL
jgi:hypothetical protein